MPKQSRSNSEAAIFVCGSFVFCIVMGTVFTYRLQTPLQYIKVLKSSALSRTTMLMGGGMDTITEEKVVDS